jgi:ATP-dependent Clp protease adaptor protein ClpS
MNKMQPFELPEYEGVLLLEEVVDEKELVVYNDDINTFDHVINTLIQVCGHQQQQAEQCTILIHTIGRCSVKLGSYEELVPMRTGIVDRGICAEIL